LTGSRGRALQRERSAERRWDRSSVPRRRQGAAIGAASAGGLAQGRSVTKGRQVKGAERDPARFHAAPGASIPRTGAHNFPSAVILRPQSRDATSERYRLIVTLQHSINQPSGLLWPHVIQHTDAARHFATVSTRRSSVREARPRDVRWHHPARIRKTSHRSIIHRLAFARHALFYSRPALRISPVHILCVQDRRGGVCGSAPAATDRNEIATSRSKEIWH